MKITWLGVVVLVILAFMGYRGYRKGFVREILSFFMVFLTLALAWTAKPYVNDFLMKRTPVYEQVRESCEKLISSQIEMSSIQEGDEGTQEDAEQSFIEKINIPAILQRNLRNNNNEETYQYLEAESFEEYVSGYLAGSIVNGLSFLVSYALATLLLKIIMCVLDAVTGLPIINGANRLTGGLVGVCKGILLVWVAFLILTVLCGTEIGKTALEMVESDSFLNLLYQGDILVNLLADLV